MKKKEIVKKMHGIVGKTTVYDTLKFFHYSKDFLNYLENETGREFLEIYGKMDKKWYYIRKFEKDIGGENDIELDF